MGLRAYSVKKYEIEYGDVCGFNYDSDTLANLICEFCEDCFLGGDYNETNDIWEINKDEFFKMTNALCKMSEDKFNDLMEDCGARKGVYTKKQVTDIFKSYYNDTPENENYVRIAWL
jgi:hypothetical protein